MKKVSLLIIAIMAVAAVPSSAQVTSEKLLPVPVGWELPKQSDIKGQWKKKYWDDQCQKAEEAAKKSVNDAVEEIGDLSPRNASAESNEPCWKPEFPVHRATGDFNGDGVKDEARILISTKNRRTIGFFAFLSTSSNKPRAIQIKIFTDATPQNFVIGTMEPGDRIETACGRGYWDCGPSEPKAITLKRDGIILGEFGAWDAVAYWDSQTNKFKVVALSD